MAEKKLTYATAIARLEKIVADIETGEVDVDQLAEKVKMAQELINFCSARLRGTQETVDKILADMQKGQEDTASAGGYEDGE